MFYNGFLILLTLGVITISAGIVILFPNGFCLTIALMLLGGWGLIVRKQLNFDEEHQ